MRTSHLEPTTRRPPKPPGYTLGAGWCRLCAQQVVDGSIRAFKGLRWHSDCREQWKFANDPSHARKVIQARDGARCKGCGHDCDFMSGWHLDHIQPLWMARDHFDDFWFWLPNNVQTLCLKCHGKKSAAETMMRAKEDRQRKKLGVSRFDIPRQRGIPF